MQARAGLVEHMGRDEGDDHRQICQETVVEEDFSEPAELGGKGQLGRKILVRGAQGDAGHVRAGELNERAAEEVAEAHAEGGQGKAGDVLVGSQGNGEEAVDQAHQKGAHKAAQHRDADGEEGIHVRGGGVLLIEEGADDAADGAHIHDARDAQVQVAGLLGEGLAGAAVQQRDALHDGSGDESGEIKHAARLPSVRFPLFHACGSSPDSAGRTRSR